MGVARKHADTQHLGLALGGQPGPFHALAQAPVDEPQVAVEPLADRGEPDAAAGALEQLGADLALLLPDRLADARGAHVQAFGGPGEVQLFRERQEDLDVT
ncbi:hypothetical protein GCM10010191_10860 [Actinomadura vinacea]|uniref:Uncharacterized protein n=1 Tax=Actinomadura vinacea TaxID=115336 RepID=A0ABP5VPG8_9ACTN